MSIRGKLTHKLPPKYLNFPTRYNFSDGDDGVKMSYEDISMTDCKTCLCGCLINLFYF